MSKIRSLLQKKTHFFGYEFIVTETISFSTTTYTYIKAHKKLTKSSVLLKGKTWRFLVLSYEASFESLIYKKNFRPTFFDGSCLVSSWTA